MPNINIIHSDKLEHSENSGGMDMSKYKKQYSMGVYRRDLGKDSLSVSPASGVKDVTFVSFGNNEEQKHNGKIFIMS
jgi:hypothetical protein